MKKIISLFTLLSATAYFNAQTVNASTSENYIYTKTCLDGNCTKKSEQVQYFDDLGRLKQAVDIKATPSGKDIVAHIQYDEFGRVTKEYLPVPQNGTQNGAIYADPLSNAVNIFGNEKIYSEKELENSPLGRIKKVTPPGNDFTAHPSSITYAANTAGEVKKYTVTTSWQDNATLSALSENGTYAANQLTKNSVTDADGNITTEFKTSDGNTVLVRKNDGTQNVDTYYVYNEFGQQVIVIPPMAAVAAVNQTALDNLCYQYRYDGLGRLVEKKLPGKGWEYMVYDKQDRLVLTRDSNLEVKGQWLFTKYDQFSRPVYTGVLDSPPGRIQQVIAVEGHGLNNETRNTASWNNSGMDVYYTSGLAYPTTNFKLLSVNYYDSYPQYSFNPSFPATILGQNVITDDQNANVSTKNLPVLSLTKNIEDDNWTKSYIWYDEKSRAVGTYSINHLGGYTKTESLLDFAGVTQLSKVYHKRLTTDTEKVITQTFEYDAQNRLKKHYHQVDSQPQELLTENTYNELSRLSNKKVGNNLQSIDYAYDVRGALTKVNDPANLNGKLFGYELKYNNPANTAAKFNGTISEVDWRTANDNVLRRYTYQYDGLNRLKKGAYSEPGSSVPENDFYNETVTYDMNSNIMSLQRNTKGVSGTASQIDNLAYAYTGNRLNSVTDSSTNYSGYPDTSGNTISYDDNGNMKNHTDKGVLQIDYNFYNLPAKITFNQTYRVRNLVTGSLTNRNVTTNYTFKADGTKLRKVYKYGGDLFVGEVTISTDYLDGFQYESQAASAPFTLKFVPTAEGYYNFENNKYIYSYTDHLGNVRLSYTQNGSGPEIIEENNFYPFGMKHEGYNALSGNPAYNYGYNGKELQKETGWSDYGARMYMSDIARWGVVDPLAEAMWGMSPYNYAMNNPISFIDPDGRRAMTPFMGDTFMQNTNSGWFGYDPLAARDKFLSQNRSGGIGPQTFGQTRAFKDLMYAAKNNLKGGLINKEGTLRWWTDYEDEDPNVTGIGGLQMLKLKTSGMLDDWYGLAGKGNWFFGTAAVLSGFAGTVKSQQMYAQGIRRGISGNYQLTGRNLSQFGKMTVTEATMPISKIGRVAKFAGHASFYLGIAFDTMGVINGDVSVGKAAINTGFGAVGNWGGSIGASLSTVYFGVDNFYPGGWPQLFDDGNMVQRELDEGFNKAGPYRINVFGAHEPK
ncbi:RHS repeat-associated core domain-containing protein [Chryseobacterium oranimense]|uniref:RHS repeat-associated core domain-containing protein n=1 Tax=Chryseobacterium oranimense TaxID=421058 RepID=UPI0021B01809|nr:RHS repeat-associated core domain-containing protein [Chryseobacterium oranimense]UWX62176.1 RHS repeat-associated core domain-containing protein [Chryseobacterium oranimense]